MSPGTTRVVEAHFESRAVGASVEYRLLLPIDWSYGEELPLVVHLHGAMSSSKSLVRAQPLYDSAQFGQHLPRALVACPSTPTRGGFYINWPTAQWETLVAEEFPAYLTETLGHCTAIAMIGASMGGYGALKVSFRFPERFAAVAAISPAVFPAEEPGSVPAKNAPAVLGELNRAMSMGTGDRNIYDRNSVYAIARAHAARIRETGLPILVDCGADDEFLLHEGAEYLHRVLLELGVDHDYRLVPGAGHQDAVASVRTYDAIKFIGGALRPL